MSVAVIGAGFGRTGTFSLKHALERLGVGPCHHMFEVIRDEQQVAKWRAVMAGGEADWEDLLRGYNSCVDWPSAFYWRELAEHYPQAKGVLSVRDPQRWYESMQSTIFEVVRSSTDENALGVRITRSLFPAGIDDRDSVIAAYERHIEEVKQRIAPDRLLVFRASDGWQPLCELLGVPIPDEPFPRSNSSDEFRARRESR